MNTFPGNPIDRLKPLADARIPVICVCGDSDRVVPFSETRQWFVNVIQQWELRSNLF